MQNCKETEGKKWALFLVAGGHFAGAVVRVHRDRSKDDDGGKTKKGKPKKVIPDTEVILHKTFHRYTSKFGPSMNPRLYANSQLSEEEAGWISIAQ